jgi:hypothetical protein
MTISTKDGNESPLQHIVLKLPRNSLHLWSLAQNCGCNCVRYHAVFTYLGHHVPQGGQGKYNTCRCRRHYHGSYRIMFANVNDSLTRTSKL